MASPYDLNSLVSEPIYKNGSIQKNRSRRAAKIYWGRSASSWVTCILCEIVLLLLLVALITVLLIFSFFLFFNEDQPRLTGMHSLLKLEPGLSFRPNTDFLSSLIRFVSADVQTYILYVQHLRAYLQIPRPSDNLLQVCKFPLDLLGECQFENNYGFDRGSPCIIIKINRVYGWLPDIMPLDPIEFGPNDILHPLLSCSGQTDADKQQLLEVNYFPSYTTTQNKTVYGMFNSHFYPFLGQTGYRQPLVALQLKSVGRYVVTVVTCQLVNVRNAGEPIKFEILLD